MKKKENNRNKISQFFNLLYIKLVKINDTPQKIALGLGLGVALGIIPGTGPVASLFLALILKINRASALLGSLFTNTWLSFVTFSLAIKTSSVIFGIEWQTLQKDWISFLRDFSWQGLLKLSILKVILPVAIGYLVIAFCLGFLVYLITLIIIIKVKHEPRTF